MARSFTLGTAVVVALIACGDRTDASQAPPEQETMVADSSAEPAAPATPASDSLITASGIGPVLNTMSEAELVDRLGPDAVERRDTPIGEGFCTPGGRVFPDSDAEIRVVWSDTTRTAISMLTVREAGSPWHTPAGVRIGSTLKELEAIKGEPVEFLGFEWDYGGGATWTEDGLRLRLYLGPTAESADPLRGDPQYREIIGDRLVRSDHPLVRRLTILVGSISLEGPAQAQVQFMCR